jgi:hypothetical protein
MGCTSRERSFTKLCKTRTRTLMLRHLFKLSNININARDRLMRDRWKVASGMDEEPWNGQIQLNMKVIGRWDMLVEKGRFTTRMAIFMKEFGIITSAMVSESIPTRKGPDMKATGKTTHSQVKALKCGQKAANMLDNMSMARNKETANILGQMAPCITEIGLITESMVLVSTSGKMEDSTMVTGTTTTCMGWVSIFTLMVSPTKDNTKRTRKPVMACTSGPTGESMTAGGTTVSNTVWVFTRIQVRGKWSMVSGNTARESLGSVLKLSTKSMTTNIITRQSLKKPKAKAMSSQMPPFLGQMDLMKESKASKRCFNLKVLDH